MQNPQLQHIRGSHDLRLLEHGFSFGTKRKPRGHSAKIMYSESQALYAFHNLNVILPSIREKIANLEIG